MSPQTVDKAQGSRLGFFVKRAINIPVFKKRGKIQIFCMDDMVPQDHLLRIIDKAIDWNFIYGLVVDKYSPDNGRPSMDPVMLIKLPFI